MSPKISVNALLRLPLICFVCMAFFSFTSITVSAKNVRIINVASLVVDSKTFKPVENALIYDAKNNILGTTNKDGYYLIKLNYAEAGEIKFKLKVAKKGYDDFYENEHWGDLNGEIKMVMYFGLQNAGSSSSSFSSLSNNQATDLNYKNVLAGFAKSKDQNAFNEKLREARQGNENILININGHLYIVDNGGWIEINSVKDAVLVNDVRIVEAGKLNSLFKRKDIKRMSPIISEKAKFAIYTN